ncbi:MAG TPA: hypothetical protein VFB99_25250 [Vicinamibacterales bacterium]|nr:hypothetical protein [Vicinamibacterales bacterium]
MVHGLRRLRTVHRRAVLTGQSYQSAGRSPEIVKGDTLGCMVPPAIVLPVKPEEA